MEMTFENDFEIQSALKKIKAEILKLKFAEGENIDSELERIEKLSSLEDEKMEILKYMKDVAVQRDKRQAKRKSDAEKAYKSLNDQLMVALNDFNTVCGSLDAVAVAHKNIMALSRQVELAMNVTHTGDSRLNTIAQRSRLRGILIKVFGTDSLQGIKPSDRFYYLNFDLSNEIKSIKEQN